MEFAIVNYRDHDAEGVDKSFEKGDYLTQVFDFNEEKEALEFLDKIECDKGDDYAEAVMDGLYDALTKVKWL